MTTQELLNALSQKNASLEDVLQTIPDLKFHDYLTFLFSQQALSKSAIIKKSTLDRTYAYQIFDGTKMPGRDKVLALSLSMALPLEETDRLLKLANQGTLYPKVKRDAVIIYAIAHHYDVLQTNEMLYEHGMEIIR